MPCEALREAGLQTEVVFLMASHTEIKRKEQENTQKQRHCCAKIDSISCLPRESGDLVLNKTDSCFRRKDAVGHGFQLFDLSLRSNAKTKSPAKQARLLIL